MKARYKILLAVVLLVVAFVAGVLVMRSCRERTTSWVVPDKVKIPRGYTTVPTLKTTPWCSATKNEADKEMASLPRGSKKMRVTTPSGEVADVVVLPGGDVVIPESLSKQGWKVVVFDKPKSPVGIEVSPWVGAGALVGSSVDAAALGGVDFFRGWNLHAGPGVALSQHNAAGVLSVGYNVIEHVQLRAGGGWSLRGRCAFAGFSIN